MNIHILIFSRDRAMQLDAVLRSLLLHCQDISFAKVKILYTTTSERHQSQYKQLQQEYALLTNLTFVSQKHFRKDVISILANSERMADNIYRIAASKPHQVGKVLRLLFHHQHPNEYVLFLVDDNLLVRDFHLADSIGLLKQQPDLLGVSLRLGFNTTYCYSLNKPQRLPDFLPTPNGLFIYPWIDAEYDFGYPLEVSSSIYRIDDILPFILGLPFHNPNSLESQMATNRMKFHNPRPLLACYQLSTTFCNPANVVQSEVPNRAGEQFSYTAEDLAERFQRGQRVDVSVFSGFTPNACHQEVELDFEQALGPA